MNKRYGIYVVLLMISAINTQLIASQEQQNELFNYVKEAVLISGGMYIMNKILAEYEKRILPDVPPHFQQWARAILFKSGLKDADAIPLKIGSGWMVVKGSFIMFDSSDVQKLDSILSGKSTDSEGHQKVVLANAERMLLHEKKHYDNGDAGKQCLVAGTIGAFGRRIIMGKSSLEDNLLVVAGSAVLAVGCARIVSIPFVRYQEKEAECYAYMNMSSLENMEINKMLMQASADCFENDLLNKPLDDERNLCEKIMRPVLSNKLNILEQKMIDCRDSSNELLKMQQQKRGLIKVASFISDHEHPDYRSLVDLAGLFPNS